MEVPRTFDDDVSGVEILFANVLFSLEIEDFETVGVSEPDELLLNAEEDEECC